MRPKLWKFERQAAAMGYQVVAGVDEVGMGPLAGPVVAGAVVLRIGDRIPGLNDSKLMTADDRERVDAIIRRRAVAVAVCAVDHTQVDRIGLYRARILASAGRSEERRVGKECGWRRWEEQGEMKPMRLVSG